MSRKRKFVGKIPIHLCKNCKFCISLKENLAVGKCLNKKKLKTNGLLAEDKLFVMINLHGCRDFERI